MLPSRKRNKKRAGLPIKVAGVEIARKVATAVLSDLVKTVAEIDYQASISQLNQSIRCVLASELHAIVASDQRGASSTVFVEILQDTIIGRDHPLSRHAKRHCASLYPSEGHVVISASHVVCYGVLRTPVGKTLSCSRITVVVRTTANRSHDELVGKRQPDGTSIGLQWSVRNGDEPMQNYNDDAENDCGNEPIIAAQEGDEIILMSERANGSEWISAEQTIDVEAMQ